MNPAVVPKQVAHDLALSILARHDETFDFSELVEHIESLDEPDTVVDDTTADESNG